MPSPGVRGPCEPPGSCAASGPVGGARSRVPSSRVPRGGGAALGGWPKAGGELGLRGGARDRRSPPPPPIAKVLAGALSGSPDAIPLSRPSKPASGWGRACGVWREGVSQDGSSRGPRSRGCQAGGGVGVTGVGGPGSLRG